MSTKLNTDIECMQLSPYNETPVQSNLIIWFLYIRIGQRGSGKTTNNSLIILVYTLEPYCYNTILVPSKSEERKTKLKLSELMSNSSSNKIAMHLLAYRKRVGRTEFVMGTIQSI